MADADPTMERLEDQITWYDTKSAYNQRMVKLLKGTEALAAAVIAFSAGLKLAPTLTAGLGAAILVLEALQHFNQYQNNWIAYRSTCEALKHEKYLYLATAGPYQDATDPHTLLAERTESHISKEHAKWVSVREESSKKKKSTVPTSE
jgi:Protein of unknown function (DUF4231)